MLKDSRWSLFGKPTEDHSMFGPADHRYVLPLIIQVGMPGADHVQAYQIRHSVTAGGSRNVYYAV